jgi:hypothetical protein
MPKKKKTTAFLKDEEDQKEIQLYEAVQNRAILEPLKKQGLSLCELQFKLEQIKNEPIKKTTLASRITRLQSAGLVRKQTQEITKDAIRSPEYRGWRIKQQENGSYQAELGFELTKNGAEALKTIEKFTEQKEALPQKDEKKKKKEDENINE